MSQENGLTPQMQSLLIFPSRTESSPRDMELFWSQLLPSLRSLDVPEGIFELGANGANGQVRDVGGRAYADRDWRS